MYFKLNHLVLSFWFIHSSTEQIAHIRSYPMIIYQVEVGRFILLVHILYRVQYRTKFDENCRCEELSYKGEVKHTPGEVERDGTV